MSEKESIVFSESLDNFEKQLGLDRLKCNIDILREYLNWDEKVCQSATIEELRGACLSISRYSLHLTDVQSKHFAIASGIERQINRLAGKLARKYAGTSFEERKIAAINNDEKLMGLYDMLIDNEMKSNRIRSVIFRLDDLVKKMENYLRRISG